MLTDALDSVITTLAPLQPLANYTGRYCFIYYDCAPFNTTYVDGMPAAGKRSLVADKTLFASLPKVQHALQQFPPAVRAYLHGTMEQDVRRKLQNIKEKKR